MGVSLFFLCTFKDLILERFFSQECVSNVPKFLDPGRYIFSHMGTGLSHAKLYIYTITAYSLPLNGDFMAASISPASSCIDLGSWASPLAKAPRASACLPRH